jgi:hypothetical protein
MLHRMDDRLYDVQTVANIFNKAKNSFLEENGVDTSSTKAQILIEFLMTNPNTNSVIVIHDPSSSLIGKRQKGGPNKKRENHLVLIMKMPNKAATAEELVFHIEYTVDDYAEAQQHALYLPGADAMPLYVTWCTKQDLRIATMFKVNFRDARQAWLLSRGRMPYYFSFLESHGRFCFHTIEVRDPNPRLGNREDAFQRNWPHPKDMKRGASLHTRCERDGQIESSGMIKDTTVI